MNLVMVEVRLEEETLLFASVYCHGVTNREETETTIEKLVAHLEIYLDNEKEALVIISGDLNMTPLEL